LLVSNIQYTDFKISTGFNPSLMTQKVEVAHKLQQNLNTFLLLLIKVACRQILLKPSASQFPDSNY
jgi:hypothetical protein